MSGSVRSVSLTSTPGSTRRSTRSSQALEAVPESILNEAIAKRIETGKTDLRKEKGQFSRQFDGMCEDTIRAWIKLGEDDREAAIQRLRSYTPRDFELDLFKPYSDDSVNPGVDYWNDLCEEAIRLLADAAWQRTTDAINQIIREYQAFPLCLTRVRSRTLTAQDVTKVWTSLAGVGTLGQPNTIGGGAKTRFEAINMHLTRITGEDVLSDVENGQKWFDQLKAVCEALRTEPRLSCRLVIFDWDGHQKMTPPGRSGDYKPGYSQYRYLQLYLGDRPQGDRIKSDTAGQTTEFAIPIDSPAAPADDVIIQFYEHQDDMAASGQLKLISPWTAVDLVLSPDAKREDDGKRWVVPLIFEGTVGGDKEKKDKYYYWVTLEFNRPIPPAGDWPTEQNWPRQ